MKRESTRLSRPWFQSVAILCACVVVSLGLARCEPAGCKTNGDCKTGETCNAGKCTVLTGACSSNSDCGSLEICENKRCVLKPVGEEKPAPRDAGPAETPAVVDAPPPEPLPPAPATWGASFGGAMDDFGRAVAVDAKGAVYITGSFTGTLKLKGTTLTSKGGLDVFIAKFDRSGALVWAVSGGSTGSDEGRGIAVDSAGNAYVTGKITQAANFGKTALAYTGGDDIFIIQVRADGTFGWGLSGGSAAPDSGEGIAVGKDGSIYATGVFFEKIKLGEVSVDSGSKNPDMYVAKINGEGKVQWIASRKDPNSAARGFDIAVGSDGKLYVTGNYVGKANFGGLELPLLTRNNLFVSQIDPSTGNFTWSVGATSGDSQFEEGLAITTGPKGGIYLTGRFDKSLTLGTIDLKSSSDNLPDIFVAKLDNTGKWLWAKSAGGAGPDFGRGIAVTPAGDVLVVGNYQKTASFGSNSLPGSDTDNGFLAILDGEGNWKSAQSFGGPDADAAWDIALDSEGKAYLVGYFTGSAKFGADLSLQAAGTTDAFVWKPKLP